VVALLKGNNYSGGTTIGVADTNAAAPGGTDQNDNGHAVDVVVGHATAFGQGNVTLTYGNIYAAADIDLGTNTYKQEVGNVYSGEDIRNAAKKNPTADTLQTSDYDTLFNSGVGHSTGSLKAQYFDLQSGTIAVPMHGGRAAGSDSVYKSTAGTVVLRGGNDYTGMVRVTDGILRIDAQTGLGESAGAGNQTIITNGTLQLGGVMTNLAENFTLSGLGYGGAASINNVTGAVRMTGVIDLTANALITNTAATGTLTIDTAAPITGEYNLTFAGSSPITLNRSLNTGIGSLIKTGTSTVTIKADSTYAGTTTVSTTVNATDPTAVSGRLIVNSVLSGGGLATVNANAVLGGTGTIAGSVVLNQGAAGTYLTRIEAGSVGGLRTNGSANFNIGGNLTINGAVQLSLLSSGQYVADQAAASLEVGGVLNLANATAIQINLNNAAFSWPSKYHLVKHGLTSGGSPALLSAADFAKFGLQNAPNAPAVASITNAATTNASTTVTLTSTAGLFLGQQISGPGIPAGAYIAAITPNASITLSAAATATASSVTLTTPQRLMRAVLVNSPGYIDVNLIGGTLYWKGVADVGGNGSQWGLGDTFKTNWDIYNYDGITMPTGPNGTTKFRASDSIVFADGLVAGASTDVSLTQAQTVGSMKMINNDKNYSFSAFGITTSGPVEKTGSGAVTFNVANNFNAFGVSFQDGAIFVGANNVFGLTAQVDVGLDGDSSKAPRLSSKDTAARSFSNNYRLLSDTFVMGDAAKNGLLTFSGVINLGADRRVLTTESDVIISGRFIDDPLASGAAAFTAASVAQGVLTKRGLGQLTIAADNAFGIAPNAANGETDYNGNIVVEAGILRIGGTAVPGVAGSTGSVNANIENRASVVFNRSNDITYGAILSGAGTMDKYGAGTLTLSNNNTMTGLSRLLLGNMVIDGSIAGSLQTSATTTLSGHGLIKGNATIAGKHSPGNSPGIQTIAGNLTYTSGASIKWELADNTNVQAPTPVFDNITVGGNLAFTGATTLSLDFKPATGSQLVDWTNAFWSQSKQWEIISVGGTTTGFSNLSLETPIPDWIDKNSAQFHVVRPGSSFALVNSGGSVFLSYSAGVLAAPQVSDVVLANTHVGVGFTPGFAQIYNGAAVGSDSLDATITGSVGGKVILTGSPSVLGIAASESGTIEVSLTRPTQPGIITDSANVSSVSQPSGTAMAPLSIQVTGTAYEYAAPSVPATVDVGKVRLGLATSAYQNFQVVGVPVSNQASSATYGESLAASWTTPQSANTVTAGTIITPLAAGASSSALTATLNAPASAGVHSGSATLALTSVAVSGSGLGNTVLSPATVGITGTAYNAAVGFVALADRTIDLGHVRVGQSFTAKSIQISNAAVAGSFTESLSALFDSALTDAGLTTSGSVSGLAAGSSNQGMTVNWSQTGTAGVFNKNTTIRMSTSGSGLPSEEVGNQVIQVTATVDAIASIVAPSPVYSGRVHVGGSFSQVDVPVTNGVAGATLENLSVWVNGSALPAGLAGSGSVTGLSAGQTSANGIQARITDTTTSGDVIKVLALSGQSVSQNLSLSPIDLSATVNITGLAYTGKGTWLAGNNDWTDGSIEAHWARWERLGGIPGRDGVLSVGDTATFAGATSEAVRLNGLSPELQALIFNGNVGATLTAVGSESFLLGKSVSMAEVKAQSGINFLNVPVSLYQDLQVTATAGASVSFGGAISSVAATNLSVVGTDPVALGGTVDFAAAVGGGLGLKVQGARLTSSVDQTFGAGTLKSGEIASSKVSPGVVNLSFATLENIASGGNYDHFVLGDALNSSKLAINLTASSFLDVKSGDLRNNAIVNAPIVVRDNAILRGVGSSQGVTVENGGKFAPGNATNTTFGAYSTSSLTLNNTSIFNIEFNANSADLLRVTAGPTTLNGQLLVSYFSQQAGDSNITSLTRFTIIDNAGHVSTGSFNDVSFDPITAGMFPLFTPHAQIFSDHVELYFTEMTVPGPGVPGATDVNLGGTHVGQAFTPGLTNIYNTAPAGYGSIDATLSQTGATPGVVIPPAVVTGVLPGASKTGDVTLATPTSVGAKNGQILVTFTSQPGNVSAGSTVINVTGTAYEYASTNLPTSVDLGSIRIGSTLYGTFHAATVPVANLASSATYGEKLNANWGATSSADVITGGSITNLAPQASSSALTLNLNSSLAAGAYSESATLNLTSVAVSGSGLQNTDTSQVIGVLGRVYNPAAGSTISTLNLGTTRVGTNFQTKPITVTNTAAPGLFTETLKAELLSPTGGVTTSGTLSALQAGQQVSSLGIGSADVATPGAKNGAVTIQYTTEGTVSGLLNEVVGSQSITVTGTVAAPGVLRNDQTARVRSTGTVLTNAVDSGRVHVGGSFGQVDVHVKNEQTNPAWVAFTETLAGVTAASSAAGFSYTHATLASLLPTVNDTATYKATITDTVTSGEIFKTLRFSANSISLDGSLAPLVVSPLDVQVMGLAYTGRGTWIASSGNWTNGIVDADWDRWELLGGIPGIDGTLSNADTASFGGAGANTVTLSAVSPRLKALNFSSVAGTTLGPAGAEHIDLGLGLAAGETVSMSVSGGQHLLQVPVTLHKDLTIDVGAQSKLTFGSLVTTALGVTSLSVTGAGSVDFLTGLTGTTPLNLSLRGATVSTGVNQTLGALDLQSGTLKSSAAGHSGSNINASSLVKSTSGTVYLGDKEAPSKLVIAGTLTLADVTAGVLRNNANLQAPVTVRANATLGGVGNSLGVNVLNDAHFAPGNSIGTYTTTSLTLNPTSNYDVEFNRASADKTIVTNGPTVRAGKINVIFLNDPNVANASDFKDKVFTIIDNTGHVATGTFAASDVAFDPATASAFPSYSPKVRMFDHHTELYFLLTQNFGTPRTISSLPNIMGRTQSMFVHSIAGDPYARLLARGPSSARGVTQNSFLSSKDNLDEAVSGAQDNTWVEGYAQTIQARQGSGNWGYDYQLGGVAGGIDLIRDQDWVMGLAFGMSQSEAKHEYNRDKTSATAYDLGLYTAATGDDSTVSFVAFYSNYDVTHTRQVDMDFTTRPASGKPKAFRTGVELGYDSNVFRTPDSKTYLRMGLGAGLAHRDGFTEKGEDAIIMNFDAVNMPYFQLDMGMGYSTDLFEGDKTWQLFGEGMFTRHVVAANPTTLARFVNAVGSSGEVTVPSPEYTYIQFQPTVGVSWREGLGSAEFKVFAEMRGGKTAPGASASYKLRF
jgi:autotransporter-associated beta strand protein